MSFRFWKAKVSRSVSLESACLSSTSFFYLPSPFFCLPDFSLIFQGLVRPPGHLPSVWLSCPTVCCRQHPAYESPRLQTGLQPPGCWALSTVEVETPQGQGWPLPSPSPHPRWLGPLLAQGWWLNVCRANEADVLKFPALSTICGSAATEHWELGLL